MTATKGERAEVISKFRVNEKDTGSPEVQIALLTQRIGDLTKHFSVNAKDVHSRIGMLQLVSRRKRLLNYLRTESPDRYRKTIEALDLRK